MLLAYEGHKIALARALNQFGPLRAKHWLGCSDGFGAVTELTILPSLAVYVRARKVHAFDPNTFVHNLQSGSRLHVSKVSIDRISDRDSLHVEGVRPQFRSFTPFSTSCVSLT
jgi:hypothetical protein